METVSLTLNRVKYTNISPLGITPLRQKSPIHAITPKTNYATQRLKLLTESVIVVFRAERSILLKRSINLKVHNLIEN